MNKATRRTIIVGLAAIPVAAASRATAVAGVDVADSASPSIPQPELGGDDRSIDQRLEQLPPLERHFARDQLHRSLDGEPNFVADGPERFWTVHFEEWKSNLAPWFQDTIVRCELAA